MGLPRCELKSEQRLHVSLGCLKVIEVHDVVEVVA
jgi:hypothetical protein